MPLRATGNCDTGHMYCSQCGSPVNNSGTCSVCGHVQALTEPNAGASSLAAGAYASWGQRAGATVIDALVLLPFSILLLVSTYSSHSNSSRIALSLLGSVAQMAYQYLMLTRRGGQTVGNRVLRTKVVAANGGALTPTHAARRVGFSVIVSVLASVPGIGLLLSLVSIVDVFFPLFDSRRQTLHDKFADTLVVLA